MDIVFDKKVPKVVMTPSKKYKRDRSGWERKGNHCIFLLGKANHHTLGMLSFVVA